MDEMNQTTRFQVIDGAYTSEVFTSLADALKDAQACADDENFSGAALITDADTGRQLGSIESNPDGGTNRYGVARA